MSKTAKICIKDGCEFPSKVRGLCKNHYAQMRKSRMPPCSSPGCDSKSVSRGLCKKHRTLIDNRFCMVVGCPQRLYARGYCSSHHFRAYRSPNPTLPPDPTAPVAGTPIKHHRARCEYPDCDNKHSGHGYCYGHLAQLNRGEELSTLRRNRKSEDGPVQCDVAGCLAVIPVGWGRICRVHQYRMKEHGSYDPPPKRAIKADVVHATAHARCRKMWGPAKNYSCVECGEQAKDWAYDGTDPTNLMVPAGPMAGQRYSAWPEFYMPMCGKCHSKRDGSLAKRELLAFRKLAKEFNLSIDDVEKAIAKFPLASADLDKAP